MHRSFECSTTESAVVKKQFTGHTAAQGASVQCMQAMVTERSPGLPSLMVTTRRRLIPQGTSCSFLHAVTQALHSMQRSASQRNFIRAIVEPPYAALTWQSVALGSCMPVTGSNPYVVIVFTLSPSTIGSQPCGYFPRWSTLWNQPAKWNGHQVTPFPTRSVTNAFMRVAFPLSISGPQTKTQAPSLMPRSAASAGLISMNMSCCSSASHLLERDSSPPASYSAVRPDRIGQVPRNGACLAVAVVDATVRHGHPQDGAGEVNRPGHAIGIVAADALDHRFLGRGEIVVPTEFLEHPIGEFGVTVLDLRA